MSRAPLALAVAAALLALPAAAHPGFLRDVERYTEALDRQPTAALYLQRSDRYRRLERWDEALDDVRRAEALGASPLEVSLARGLVLFEKRDDAAALEALDAYLGAGGAEPGALRAHGRLLARVGKPDLAALDFERELQRGTDPELCLEYADLRVGQGRAVDAAQVLERCLQGSSGASVLRRRLVEVRLGQRDFASALAQAREGASGLQVKAEWTLLAADVLQAWGRPREARREREAALRELDALLAVRGGGYQRLLRAQALAALGREREALASVDALLASNPAFTEAAQLKARLSARSPKRSRP